MACLAYASGRNCVHWEEVFKMEYKCLCSIDGTYRFIYFSMGVMERNFVYLKVPGKVPHRLKLGLGE